MKYIVYLILPLILLSLYGGCGGDGNNISEEDQIVLDNLCFLLTSDDPCFDPNEGSETRSVDDMTVEEVIADETNKAGFVRQLEFAELFSSFRRSFFLPPVREGCSWGDVGLVIKTSNDWDNYRNNCYFTDNFFELPDVDFSDNMVIVSLKGTSNFGTEIVAVLEFESELVAVVSDSLSDVPSSESGRFGSSVIEIERRNLPVSFVRVEDICNSFFNFSNSECIAESMLNVCEGFHCSSASFSVSPRSPCTFIDCNNFHCEMVRTSVESDGPFSMIVFKPGTFSNLELDEFDSPIGIIEVEDMEEEFSCSIVVE